MAPACQPKASRRSVVVMVNRSAEEPADDNRGHTGPRLLDAAHRRRDEARCAIGNAPRWLTLGREESAHSFGPAA
jgi:hypothetical protein